MRRPDLVEAREEAAEDLELPIIGLVGGATAYLREHGAPDPGTAADVDGAQRVAAYHERRDGGNLERHQLGEVLMLRSQGRFAPASGAVELGDDARLVLERDLVDAVLERAQREHVPRCAAAVGLHGVEHAVRRERVVRLRRRVERERIVFVAVHCATVRRAAPQDRDELLRCAAALT